MKKVPGKECGGMADGKCRVLTSNSWQSQQVHSPFWGNWSAGNFCTVRGSMKHAQLLR